MYIMSNFMLNFNNQSQGYLESLPQLAGKLWGDAMFYLPDATPFGLVQASRHDPDAAQPPFERAVTPSQPSTVRQARTPTAVLPSCL